VRISRLPNLRHVYLDLGEFDFNGDDEEEFGAEAGVKATKHAERPGERMLRLKAEFEAAGVSWHEG